MEGAAFPSPITRLSDLPHLGATDSLRYIDTRWKLGSPETGYSLFLAGHIPGAVHLDMDRHLAAPPGRGGRHPLPEAAAFAQALSQAGVDDGVLVVAYDDGDATGAARLWWLLRHFGHHRVTILDGGLRAWLEAGRPVEQGQGLPPPPRRFEPRVRLGDTVDSAELHAAITTGAVHLLDARGPERWRGEIEPVDPVAGRIPGSVNAPAADNLRDGRFRPPEELRAIYDRLGVLDGRPIVASCGSGVTACIDLLALELAGVTGARLYPGSYSGWIAEGLPTERG